MKLAAQAQARLNELLAKGTLPSSACGVAFLKLLAPLLESGVLTWRRSGAGRQLSIVDADALQAFCRQRFPEVNPPPEIGARVAGVGRFRDSKALPNTGSDILSMRVWDDRCLLKGGKPAGAAAATNAHGLFSFRLTHENDYQLNGSCLLVENPAVFAAAENLAIPVSAVIYGYGRISGRALDWLASSTGPDFRLLHLPDYDPVGLSEFGRVQAKLGERAELYLPMDLETRFERFANGDLLRKRNSQAMLTRLREAKLPAIRRVVELIDRHNAGLEQEALLLAL